MGEGRQRRECSCWPCGCIEGLYAEMGPEKGGANRVQKGSARLIGYAPKQCSMRVAGVD